MSKLKRFLKIKFAKNKDLAIFQLVNEIAEVVSEDLAKLKEKFDTFSEKTLEELKSQVKEKVVKRTIELRGDKGERGETGKQGLRGEIGKTGAQGIQGMGGESGASGKRGEIGKQGEKGENGKDGSPDTGDEIIGKINKASELIDASRIKNLPVEGKRFGSVGAGGSEIKSTDLSSQLDGSTKDFTVPANKRFNSLMGTQFPIVYRPTTDFTGSGTTTLTLTSEVSAPEEGQTLILTYAEP